MEKVIIILNGVSEGKTKFVNIIKGDGYWTWNINHLNLLGSLARDVGWNGDREDGSYFKFLKEFENIANKYYDFKRRYAYNMIEKFNKSNKATVLIIHSMDSQLGREIQERNINCYNIYIAKNDEEKQDCHKTLNCEGENYTGEVLGTMDTLTKNIKEFKKEEGE